jgi:hypothetical protein
MDLLEQALCLHVKQFEDAHQDFKRRFEIEFAMSQIILPQGWSTTDANDRARVAAHCTQILYQRDQLANETTCLPGLVLVNENLFEVLKRYNDQKQTFKDFMLTLKKEVGEYTYRKWIHQYIHPLQWNLLQVFRQFKCIDETIESLSYSWVTSDSAIKKIGPQQAMEFVEKRVQNEVIKASIHSKIGSLRVDQFAIKKMIPPHIQATIRTTSCPRKKFKVHSPIFLTQQNLPVLSQKELPLSPPLRNRKSRSDKKSLAQVYEGLELFYYI